MSNTPEEILKHYETYVSHKGNPIFLKDNVIKAMTEYASIVSAEKDKEIGELKAEVIGALDALCDMWDQYCGGEYGHMCMSAVENAANVLDKYKLLKNDNGYGGEVDWDKLTELKTRGQSSNNL